MGKSKAKEVLDWYGNPIPESNVPRPQEGIKGETGPDCRKYLRPWSADGKPGKRVALEESYLVIRNSQGKIVYDLQVPAASRR
jgi:hypothetical protein